jgi:hypothetical protein
MFLTELLAHAFFSFTKEAHQNCAMLNIIFEKSFQKNKEELPKV